MSDREPIRLVVVDDHNLFRQGLVALLDASPDIVVVGQAATGAEALDVAGATEPDVVLMDITMPDMNGIEATSRLLERLPTAAVVMVTMLEDDDSLFAAMCAGAHGYLLKGADAADVLGTVRAVAAGQAVFGPEVARRLTAFFQQARGQGLSIPPFPALTEREREILDLIAQGDNNQRIARHLAISAKTVANHTSSILTKLQVSDRAQAIVAAREAGLGR